VTPKPVVLSAQKIQIVLKVHVKMVNVIFVQQIWDVLTVRLVMLTAVNAFVQTIQAAIAVRFAVLTAVNVFAETLQNVLRV